MFELSALELAAAIRAGKLRAPEVVGAYINRIEEGAGHNAFTVLAKEKALARADKLQAALDRGEYASPLAGVPIALKDNISTAGLETGCASKILRGYEPVYDATVVTKLEEAGLIVVGKLNMDEFAMGGSSETGCFGPVLNPRDKSRVAGGSSGGSAAAVAGGEIPLTLGSDTGGSIRQPCSFCGTTGIKPTYGAVSRHGLIAFASSLDQIGPIGRNIDDCAALLSIISGPDAKDSTCTIEKPFDFSMGQGADAAEKIRGLKIGLPLNYFDAGIDPDVKETVLAAAREFAAAGATLTEFEMPLMEYVVPAYYIIACAEASSNLSRFDGLKYGLRSDAAQTLDEAYCLSRSEGFGLEVKKRIMLGSFVLSSGYYDAYYKKALQIRTLVGRAFDELFERFDMILAPVAPTSAYRIGEHMSDPLKMYMSDIYTVSVNMAGLPAVALPCGFGPGGLPIGCQLIGPAFSEALLIGAARAYQRRTRWHEMW